MIVCKGLCKSFGGLNAIDDVSFQVKGGQIFGIIGPNGAGKSTLFNIISGFLEPDNGEVFFEGKNLRGIRPDQRYLMGLAMTFQLPQYFPGLSVLDNVVMGALTRNYIDQKNAYRTAGEILSFIGLDHKRGILAKNLTAADLKRLEIGKVLAGKPKCVLLDEVMAGLTENEVSDVIALVKAIKRSGITVVIIEHVMKAIMAVSEVIMVLNYGRKIAIGKPEEVVSNRTVIESYLGG